MKIATPSQTSPDPKVRAPEGKIIKGLPSPAPLGVLLLIVVGIFIAGLML